ncbi:MAG: hypothetical protein OXE99_00870 [Cellvibrionales bacterium]|nr:hypothetical protein [Cellvibrionales bacterium]
MLKQRLIMLLSLVASILMLSVGANAAFSDWFKSNDAKQTISQDINEVVTKLNLSEEQKKSVGSIIQKSHEAKKQVFHSAGLDMNNIREGRAAIPDSQRKQLMQNLRNIDNQTSDQLSRILNKDQMKQWKSWLNEKREMRKHMFRLHKGTVAGGQPAY